MTYGDTEARRSAFAEILDRVASRDRQAIVLAIALVRADQAALEGFAHPDHLYYWRSADGREVDFLVTDRTLVAVESKYGAHRTGKDYESMTKAFGRGIMVSRRDVELARDVLTVPVGVFLALLG